ncbi:phage tail protein [Haemophilus paraphrohaemolyticus]|uniref:Phage tail collar domain protein n=1 Tax=Haemophilus paraphrohaemolyticus HK411 TaxID=1095743 RepID=I2NLR3_9PAST|nr:phage tail protein [Haemophilus paraphrohaemolyticus]EIG26774.1 phage tail collar domain protein [Haemophilus paraphrohaemolyticus HK411]OOR93537.1 phage tail protein [Haemophilus paraphrohaemolyticus]STP00997.1 Phage Tail Collar Domain [Haemophilus paraphrohaemolyticus]
MANLILTRQWVENIYQLETSDPVMGGPDGIDNRQAKELGARTNYLKDQVDGINQDRTGYAPKANPAFTGVPTAPTAALGTNNTQIATTAFVKTAIAALVGSAPAALDTLEELARALAGDANLKATLLAEIGKKANATDFNALHDLFIGIPIPYPLSTIPTGCLAMNGQRFDTRRYPKLAQKYPSGQLPDLRGEFIRGWDNGRGVDAGRGVLSVQAHATEAHSHKVVGTGSLDDYAFIIQGGVNIDKHIYLMTSGNGIRGGKGQSELLAKHQNNISETRPRNIAYHYICLAE